MRHRVRIISCLLLATGCSGLAQSLSNGMKAWDRGDYQTAESALAQLSRRDPAARLAYARVLREIGKYSEAEAVARVSGNDPRMVVELSHALRLQGKYEEAESVVTASLLPTGRLAYAELLRRRGQIAKAREVYQAVVQGSHKDWESALAAAQSLQRLEDFHRANSAFQDLLDQYPDSIEIRLAWADLFLEKYNAAEAMGLYEEVLKKNSRHPLALVGMARCISDSADPRGREVLERALETNQKFPAVFQILARHLIEEEQYEAAAKELDAAEKIDPRNLETWSLRAAIAYFSRRDFKTFFDQIASVNSHYGEAWLQLGELCASQRRFEEAIGFFNKAIGLYPGLWRAHAALGINLLRLGAYQEGKEALERSYRGDPFHVWTVNTLRLLDSFKYYQDSQTAHFRVRIQKKEEVLRDLAEDLLERSYQALTERYHFSPPFITNVEFYPNHEDFAVRTLGVPGLGALGATFGKVVALDSPLARKKGEYNWASTLWHEVAHIFALSLSDMKVPRWLTEGLSTYEEQLARPGWGRKMDPVFVAAANKGQLLPLKELSTGFLRPKYPEQILVSYTHGSLVCRYLAEQYGWEKLRELLRAFRDKNEVEAFQSIYGKSLEQLDMEFQAYLKPRLAQVAAQLDISSTTEYMKRVREAEGYFKSGEWAKAAESYRQAASVEPEPRYPVNVFLRLGEAEENLGNAEAAAEAFLQAGQLSETGEEAYRRAFDLAMKRNRQDVAAAAYENLVFLYPADADLHLAMGEAWLRWNRPEQAVAPLKRVTEIPNGDTAQAYYLLGRAYWNAGKLDLARKAVLAALDIAPAFEKAQQLLLQITESRK
ncbi:MAG: tetratricopeptide repeat protein [Acidobacteria bacterium]|nr:tetratricopeptide repeat protein [Acidobacteriota bacterium]